MLHLGFRFQLCHQTVHLRQMVHVRRRSPRGDLFAHAVELGQRVPMLGVCFRADLSLCFESEHASVDGSEISQIQLVN
jgi:hypothetical protein